MDTFTHAEDSQNNIFPKVKELVAREMQRLTSKGRARHSEVPKSLHASLDISTHTFNVYILKTGTEHSGRKTIRYDGETRSYQKNILNKNLLFSRQKSRAYLKFDLHLHGF